MRLTARILLVTTSVAALGCGDRNGVTNPEADVHLLSAGDFRVSVSSGTTPTFSWSGGPASVVSVDDLETGDTPWDLWPSDYNGSVDRIRSPLAYGSRPSGTMLLSVTRVRALVQGHHYLVTVLRDNDEYGQQEFVP